MGLTYGELEWVRCTSAHPCPVCGRPKWCSVSKDDVWAFCTQEPSDRPAKNGKVGWMHRIADAPIAPRTATRRRVVNRIDYRALNADGELVALHRREDYDDGLKDFRWYGPDGKIGIKRLGLSDHDVPLYRLVDLLAADPGRVVVVTEGEKAADALASLGVVVVGTMTGAAVVPAVTVLAPIAGRQVLLWPDNDQPGVKHMRAIAARLAEAGGASRIARWTAAPPKGDAADFVAAGLGLEELAALYETAEEYVPPESLLPEDWPKDSQAPATLAHMTDLGNAERLVVRHGDDIRWCDDMGRWLYWEGGLWRQTTATILQDLAKETVLSIYRDAELVEDQEQRVALLRWAKTSSSARAIGSMVTLTKTVVGETSVESEELDADPMLLGVEGGVVDLRTGEGREPRRDDFITKSCRAGYDPEALCPLWLGFLDRVFGQDADLIAYVQRAVGYSLTGKTGERVVFIAHGAGANGKTTFQEVVAHVIGTYATSTPVETLIAKKDRGIPNDVARLKSARFVSATESERGAKLAEAFIKAVTGGDRVQARFLHQEFFEFVPQLKLWLATNHRPEISGGGKAIWSRIRLIPFEVEIPPEERDPELKQKLLQEAPGILAWAVRGCLAWQVSGLGAPSAVEEANRHYEEDEDVLGWFLEDRCVVEPHVWCSAADLYGSFQDWAKAHGEEQISAKAFSQSLAERHGIKRHRQGGTGKKGFGGVRLLDGSVTSDRQDGGEE